MALPQPSALPAPLWQTPGFDLGNVCMMVLNTVLLLGALVWAVGQARKHSDGVPLALLAGGALCTAHEPLLDVIAGCFIPYSPTWSAFELYGRTLTWWHPLSYAVFYGLSPALLRQKIQQGGTAGQILGFMVGVVIFDVVMEGIAVHCGTWYFIGEQPLTVAGMPLWWGAMNSIGVLTTATAVVLAGRVLQGWRAAWLVLWLPVQHAAEVAIVGWPSWAVLNTDVSPMVREAGGLLSFVIFGVLTALCTAVLRREGYIAAAGHSSSGGSAEPLRHATSRPASP